MIDLNSPEFAQEVLALVDQRLIEAFDRELPKRHYGDVTSIDVTNRSVSVKIFGEATGTPGFRYSTHAPPVGAHVAVRIDSSKGLLEVEDSFGGETWEDLSATGLYNGTFAEADAAANTIALWTLTNGTHPWDVTDNAATPGGHGLVLSTLGSSAVHSFAQAAMVPVTAGIHYVGALRFSNAGAGEQTLQVAVRWYTVNRVFISVTVLRAITVLGTSSVVTYDAAPVLPPANARFGAFEIEGWGIASSQESTIHLAIFRREGSDHLLAPGQMVAWGSDAGTSARIYSDGAAINIFPTSSAIIGAPTHVSGAFTAAGQAVIAMGGASTAPVQAYDVLGLRGASNHAYLRIRAPKAYDTGVAFDNDTNGQDWAIYRPAATRDLVLFSSDVGINVMKFSGASGPRFYGGNVRHEYDQSTFHAFYTSKRHVYVTGNAYFDGQWKTGVTGKGSYFGAYPIDNIAFEIDVDNTSRAPDAVRTFGMVASVDMAGLIYSKGGITLARSLASQAYRQEISSGYQANVAQYNSANECVIGDNNVGNSTRISSGYYTYIYGGSAIMFTIVSNLVVRANVDWVDKPTAGSWAGYSDPRLKQKVRSLRDEIDSSAVLRQVRPILYEWNGLAGTVKGQQRISVLGNELLDVAPWMMMTTPMKLRKRDKEDTELLQIDPSDWPYHLIDGWQDHDARLARLEAAVGLA